MSKHSLRPQLAAAAVLALGIGGSVLLAPAHAATPASVTVGVDGAAASTATYTGASVVGNDDPLGQPAPSCAPMMCDQETVVLKAPDGYTDAHVLTLSVTFTFTDSGAGNALDVGILDSTGALVASKTSIATGAVLSASNLEPGTYTVEVDGDTATTPQTYDAAVAATGATKVVQKSNPKAGLGFSREAVASPYVLGTEPNLAIDPNNTTVYSSPIFGTTTTISFLLRSNDEGKTFLPLGNQIPETGTGKVDQCTGGGDSDLVTDKFSGDVYMIDLGQTEVPARVSHDNGNTFASNCDPGLVNPTAGGTQGVNYFPDRQWLSYDAKHQRTWFIYRDGLIAPPDSGTVGGIDASKQGYGEYLKYSQNATSAGTAGMDQVSFTSLCTQAGAATPCVQDVSIAGNAVTDNSPTSPRYGTTYLALNRTGAGVGVVAINPDDAANPYVEHSIPGNQSQELFPTVAVDSAGTVYEAWVDDTSFQTKFSASKDGGTTWTPVQTINANPAATTIMPWIVAGSPGRVAVAYYGTANPANPTTNYGPWNGFVAESTDADANAPTFTQDQFTDRQNHIDPICLSGLGCTTDTGPAGDRELGDFFKMALDGDGRLVISFADGDNQLGKNAAGQSIPAPSFAHVIHQTSGPSLLASVGTVSQQPVPTNTVTVPAHTVAVPVQGPTGAAGPDDQALALTSDSLTVGADGKLHATIQVATLDTAAAASSPALPFTTYWLRWIYKDHVYWAGAEVDATGGVSYYGGEPGALNDGLANKYADYPGTVTPTGSIDQANNTFVLTLDPASFGNPTAADILYAVTGYVSTHATPTPPVATSTTDLPDLVDALPSFNTGPLATGTAPVVLPPDAVPPATPTAPTPASAAAPTSGSLASTGGLALVPLALVTILGGAVVRRRRAAR